MSDRNRKLFEVFVRENGGSLIAYLRVFVRDAGLAEDLFQETLLTAWRRFDEFDSTQPLAPWLRGIARNLVRNAWRKQANDRLIFDEATAELAENALASIDDLEADTWKERLAELAKCVSLLPPRSQSLVRASYVDGERADVIAGRLGLAQATIRKRLQRIREQLALCVQERTERAW